MRTPYCTGCNKIFDRMHVLMNHRRTQRCGGRFLAEDKREIIDELHLIGSTIHDHPDLDEPVFAKVHVDVYKGYPHRHRTPGTIRPSHLKGGSGYRNNWED